MTNLPTFPDAPMTAIVSPGCKAFVGADGVLVWNGSFISGNLNVPNAFMQDDSVMSVIA